MRNGCGPRLVRFEALILGGLAVMGPFATDTLAPVLPAVAQDLDAGTSATQLTLTTYLVALGAGQVLAGPVSDAFGRRAPVLLGCVLYCLAGALCAVAQSVPMLCGARFLQGAAAAAGVAISRAVVRDLHSGTAAARAFSRLFLVVALSPVVGPIAATQILHVGSWRGVFLLLSAFGLVLSLIVAFALPETLPRDRRTARGVGRSLRTMGRLARDPHFTGYAIPLGCGTAALVAMVGGAPFVVEDGYGRSTQLYAAIFVVCALGNTGTTLLNGALVGWASPQTLLQVGLGAMLASGVLLLTVGRLGLWAFSVCFALVVATWGLIAANATALALRGYAAIAGTAAALAGFVQYATGAATAPVPGLLGGSAAALGIVVVAAGAVGSLSAGWTSARTPRTDELALEALPAAPAADIV